VCFGKLDKLPDLLVERLARRVAAASEYPATVLAARLGALRDEAPHVVADRGRSQGSHEVWLPERLAEYAQRGVVEIGVVRVVGRHASRLLRAMVSRVSASHALAGGKDATRLGRVPPASHRPSTFDRSATATRADPNRLGVDPAVPASHAVGTHQL
jgi:hypothetical protein